MECQRRVRAAVAVGLLSTSVALCSSDALSEGEAIRIFLDRSPEARRVQAVERAVDAEFRLETRIANPELAYEVEEAGGTRDEFLSIQQQLPISGRRGLLAGGAVAAASAAALAAESTLHDAVYALKASFCEVLYRQRVLETLRAGEQELERTVEIFDRLEREGEGAGYDLLRAEQELAQLRVESAGAEAGLAAARSRFGAYFDPALKLEAAELEGSLQPAGPIPDLERAVESALEQRLGLKALAAEGEQRELERKAAHRLRIPEPVVNAGFKRTAALGSSDTGYVASVTVPLPLFDRGALDAARAVAEADRVDLDTEILRRRIRAEVGAAVARERAAREASGQLDEAFERRAADLSRIARLRYDEGESGIFELLDAHRTALAVRLRVLAVRYEARLAEIDRQRITGDEAKP